MQTDVDTEEGKVLGTSCRNEWLESTIIPPATGVTNPMRIHTNIEVSPGESG
jgi:hypothetical protein